MFSPVFFYPENTAGRDFVIGDIHGCYDAVRNLLNTIGFRPSVDRLFCVGDLVDRGPQSIDVLNLARQHWFFSCRGNHEQMLIDYLRASHEKQPYDKTWLKKCFKSFTEQQQFAGAWLPVLDRMPYVMSVGKGDDKFYVVHAEILEQKASVTPHMLENWLFNDPQKAEKRSLWGRSLLTAFNDKRPVKRAHDSQLSTIYCGHTIVKSPIQVARQIYLDGGAYLAYDEEKLQQLDGFVIPCLNIVEPKTQQVWSYNMLNKKVSILEVDCPETL